MKRHVLALTELVGVVGGAERHLELLAAAASDLAIEFEVAVLGDAVGDEAYVARLRLAGARVSRLSVPSHRCLWTWVRSRRPSTLHWNFRSPFSFRAGAMLCKPWGAPSVVTDHLPMLRGGRRWEATRALANRRISAMVVSSEDSRRAAERHWRKPPPIHVVPNATLNERFRLRQRSGDGEIRLLMLARLEEQKNPLHVVRTVRSLRNAGVLVSLDIVGDGALRQRVEHEIDALGLCQYVRLVGYEDDPIGCMLAADLFVTAASAEGLPIAVIEALSTGLPVVASDIGPHREIAARTRAVRLVQGGAPEWSEAIRRSAAELRTLSDAAVATREAYSLDAMRDRIAAVYEAAGALA